MAYQGWDGIEECPLTTPMPTRQPVSRNADVRTYPSGSAQRQPPAADRRRVDPVVDVHRNPISQSGGDGHQQGKGADRSSKQREYSPDTRVSASVTKSGPNSGGTYNQGKPSGPVKSAPMAATPLPQRTIQNRGRSGTSVSEGNARGPSDARQTSGTREGSTQSATHISWADEPIPDIEIMEMPPSDSYQMNSTIEQPIRANDVSRSDILREAIVETQRKEMMNRQQLPAEGIGKVVSDKGEKRNYDSSSSGENTDGGATSYADMADKEPPWNIVSYNKKKKVDDPSMELLGMKEAPNKDIFVVRLDYSRCRKPSQLK